MSSPEISVAYEAPEAQKLYDLLWLSSPATLQLAQSLLFKPASILLNIEERTRLTYQRAKAICQAHSMFRSLRILFHMAVLMAN